MPAPDSEGNIRLSDNLSVYTLLRLLFSLRTDWKISSLLNFIIYFNGLFYDVSARFDILKTFCVGEALDKFNKP